MLTRLWLGSPGKRAKREVGSALNACPDRPTGASGSRNKLPRAGLSPHGTCRRSSGRPVVELDATRTLARAVRWFPRAMLSAIVLPRSFEVARRRVCLPSVCAWLRHFGATRWWAGDLFAPHGCRAGSRARRCCADDLCAMCLEDGRGHSGPFFRHWRRRASHLSRPGTEELT